MNLGTVLPCCTFFCTRTLLNVSATKPCVGLNLAQTRSTTFVCRISAGFLFSRVVFRATSRYIAEKTRNAILLFISSTQRYRTFLLFPRVVDFNTPSLTYVRVLETIRRKSSSAPKIDFVSRRTAVYRVVFYRVSTRDNICDDRLLRRKGRRTRVSFALYSLLLFLVPSESNFVLLVSQTLVQQKHNKHGYPGRSTGRG